MNRRSTALARRTAGVAGLVLTALLVLGCDFGWLFIEQNQKNPPAQTQEKPGTAAPGGSGPSAAQNPASSIGLAGTWTGTMAFTDYTMLIKDKTAAEMFSDEIEGTLEEPYPIVIRVESDEPAGSAATLTFGEEAAIKGTATRTGDKITFSFKRAGTKNMAVGATPPVSFKLTGSIGGGPALRGTVVYTVLQASGAKAWVQNGRWDAARD